MKTEKKLFPLYTDLTQKKAVVIGGGKNAARSITSLRGFVGELVVIACREGGAYLETERIPAGRSV